MPVTPESLGAVNIYRANQNFCCKFSTNPTIPCQVGDDVQLWLDPISSANLGDLVGHRPTFGSQGGYSYVNFATSQYMISNVPTVTDVPLSIAAWRFLNATDGDIFGIGDQNADGDEYLLRDTAGTNLAYAQNAIGNNSASATATDTLLVWEHVVAVFASTTSRASYLNGGHKGTNATLRPVSAANVNQQTIGTRTGSNANTLNGRIAELAVFNFALTDQNVLDLFNAGLPTGDRPLMPQACL